MLSKKLFKILVLYLIGTGSLKWHWFHFSTSSVDHNIKHLICNREVIFKNNKA